MRAPPILAIAVCLASFSAGEADTVVKRDGARVTGTLISVDASSVVIGTSSGPMSLPRADVATITFGGPKPLKVELKNVRSDDAVDVAVDGDDVIRGASEGGEWIDITDKLKEGNNAIRLRIHNDRGVWAYRLSLRINGHEVPIECGTPRAGGPGCSCCGKTGREVGIIDDLPDIWLFVDRADGRAELLP